MPTPEQIEALARYLNRIEFGIGSYWGGEFCLQRELTRDERKAIIAGLFALAAVPRPEQERKDG